MKIRVTFRNPSDAMSSARHPNRPHLSPLSPELIIQLCLCPWGSELLRDVETGERSRSCRVSNDLQTGG
jgi:hypothetical protein